MDDKTHFGFTQVETIHKKNLVSEVFSSVANKYDIMNDIMSFGTHRYWKDEMLKEIKNFKGKLIDVAGGTGDISKRFYKHAKKSNIIPDITICDINFDMLKKGRDNLLNQNIFENIKIITGDAQNLPFKDNYFDYYTISFGIRNVTDIKLALKEAFRVLKPGGKFICLEFSKIQNPILEKFYNYYSFNVIPHVGKAIANDYNSYKYLVESINLFPSQDKFLTLIDEVGFLKTKFRNLSNGIVAIHTGWKI